MVSLLLSVFIIGSTSTTTIGSSGLEISFSLDKVDRKDLAFPEARWLSENGEPNLGSLLYKIGIPQEGKVEVRILYNEEEIIRDMMIEPDYYVGIAEPPFADTGKFYAEVYRENKYFPEDLVEVSKPAYLRDIYTVDVRINPMRYNPITRELRVSKNIRLSVEFKGKPRIRQIIDSSFEQIYQRTIVNYEQCKNWRREASLSSRNPFEVGTWYKIDVDEEAIYKITHEEIKNVGLDPSQFNPRTMKIYTAPFDILPRSVLIPDSLDSLIEIPIYVHGENDGFFNQDDYLLFYGYPASHYVVDSEVVWFENGYARNNVYWFTFGGSAGKRMERIDATWNGEDPDTLIKEIIHYEEDRGNPTRSGVNWYWLDVSPGAGPSGGCQLSIAHPKASGAAVVSVGIFTLDVAEFWYRFSFDGANFFNDTLNLPRRDIMPPHYLAGSGVISGDSSIFNLDITRPSGTTGELTAYLNTVDIQYERLTDLNKPFHAYYSTQADYSIKCTNINSPPFVFDITNLNRPKMFYNLTLTDNTMFLSSSTDSLQLLFFSKLSLTKSAKLSSAYPGRLRTQSSGCEYLFITHRDFYNAIMPLVDYRSQQYLTKVVLVDDIYDDFSFGKFDPLAIKHFLYFTTDNWATVPTYVLLVGDATYDYKNNLNKVTPPNYIPLYEAGTKLTGNAGFPDNHIYEGEYVNFGAGEAMVLGRITVRTNQEVRDFIDKLISYETGNIDGMWNKRVILAGDDEFSTNWEGLLHCGACEDIISYTPDSLYDFAKVYMVSYPPFSYPTTKPNAQEAFIRELNKGGFAGVFYGHGNTHQLAHEGLFYDYSVPRINNGRRFFFFYFGSCTVGRFDDSDYECIGEQLVRKKDGAIGTMGATKGTFAGSNILIGNALFNLITDTDSSLTMGECFRIAKSYGSREYVLIGDPAARLKKMMTPMNIAVVPDTIDSIKPLEKLRVNVDETRYYLKAFIRDTTHIEKFDATTADRIGGHVYRQVQYYTSFIPFDYEIDGKEIYIGYWDEDTATIIVPKIATTHLPIIKLSSYIDERSGVDSIRVYGFASPSADNTGPDVTLYEGGRKLKDGDWVNKDFILTGTVSDESGINLINSIESTNGFYMYINNDLNNKIDLRDYFTYDRNSFTEGEFNVGVSLPAQVDTLTINIVDNNFNQTVKKIVLNTEIYNQIAIENFLIYPNPVRDNNGVWFTFVLSRSGMLNLKIFTIAGRLIKSIENFYGSAGYNQIFWDGLDDYKDGVSNGVYLVKAYVEADNYNDEVIEKFIIAR